MNTVTGSAPGRVNLIGEHTDYNGGVALPLALPHRTRARVQPRADGVVTASSSAPGSSTVTFDRATQPGDVDGWAAYVAGVFWSLRESGHEVPGADVVVDSDVPRGAGLSSSAALECAVLVALDRVAGLGLDRTGMALIAQRAENDYVGAPTGAMDQMAAMHGGDGQVVLFDARAVSAQPIPCDLDAAGLALLIIDTRAAHSHADGEYGARRASCEEAAAQLGVSTLRALQEQQVDAVVDRLGDDVLRRRVRHILTENARVLRTVDLLRAGKVPDIAPLLTESHASMRDDYEISAPEVDVAVEAAMQAGALGARMTGGGFGGSVIALVDRERSDAVAEGARTAFERNGFTEPHTFVVVPAVGAGVQEDQ
ncbi:galactokinase [Haloactinopolyspora alba]|uniref:galactokinase n=1 Tax=Haloactinopolyspora alba TaxID=648780 RepID=UPI00101DC5F7|nr:galactokinase [Haloactinopolyspora alba]